jgi:hypothetical protein
MMMRLRLIIGVMGAAVIILVSADARADGYGDNCVVAVTRILPPPASVQGVTTATAPIDTVRSLGRITTMRWVLVNLTMSIGGRKIAQSYICSENRDGDRIVVPTDRSGPGPTHDWTVR